jgi:hypothetical protein
VPELPPHDPDLRRRIGFLIRLESMVNVGCKFGPNDLTPDTWDQLVALALERQFVQGLLDRRREKKGETEHRNKEAHRQTGIPAPGGTFFKSKIPFKGPTR